MATQTVYFSGTLYGDEDSTAVNLGEWMPAVSNQYTLVYDVTAYAHTNNTGSPVETEISFNVLLESNDGGGWVTRGTYSYGATIATNGGTDSPSWTGESKLLTVSGLGQYDQWQVRVDVTSIYQPNGTTALTVTPSHVTWNGPTLTRTKTASANAVAKAVGLTKTVTASGQLASGGYKTVAATGVLQKQGNLKTVAADARLVLTATPKTVTGNAVLKALALLRETTANAVLVLTGVTKTKTVAATAVLRKSQTATVTANAVLVLQTTTYTKTVTANAVLKGTVRPTVTANAVLIYGPGAGTTTYRLFRARRPRR